VNQFNNSINLILCDDWKSAAAAGLLGLGIMGGAKASEVPQKPQTAQVQSVQQTDLNPLIDALVQVESNGKANAVGDKGRAKGILQIWDVVVSDVNRIYKTSYVHDDAFDPKKARDIANKYLTFWGKHYTKKTGKAPTYEVYARIWNGGPTGYKKEATVKYWTKVKNILK